MKTPAYRAMAFMMSFVGLVAMARGHGEASAGFWIACAIFWNAYAIKEASGD